MFHSSPFTLFLSNRYAEQQRDAGEHEHKDRGLAFKVRFMEKETSCNEGDCDAGPPYRVDYRNERAAVGQRVKIGEIGRRDQEADERDRPPPDKYRGPAAAGEAEKKYTGASTAAM